MEEIITEEFIDSEITQEELDHTTVDSVIEIIEESNHTEEFYVEAIQDLDVSYRDLVSYED